MKYPRYMRWDTSMLSIVRPVPAKLRLDAGNSELWMYLSTCV